MADRGYPEIGVLAAMLVEGDLQDQHPVALVERLAQRFEIRDLEHGSGSGVAAGRVSR
jgi:hypothetical protein